VNIKLLQDLGLDDIELDVQPESLKLWAKMAVRVNMGMVHIANQFRGVEG